jgi:hypothetical protein
MNIGIKNSNFRNIFTICTTNTTTIWIYNNLGGIPSSTNNDHISP